MLNFSYGIKFYCSKIKKGPTLTSSIIAFVKYSTYMVFGPDDDTELAKILIVLEWLRLWCHLLKPSRLPWIPQITSVLKSPLEVDVVYEAGPYAPAMSSIGREFTLQFDARVKNFDKKYVGCGRTLDGGGASTRPFSRHNSPCICYSIEGCERHVFRMFFVLTLSDLKKLSSSRLRYVTLGIFALQMLVSVYRLLLFDAGIWRREGGLRQSRIQQSDRRDIFLPRPVRVSLVICMR